MTNRINRLEPTAKLGALYVIESKGGPHERWKRSPWDLPGTYAEKVVEAAELDEHGNTVRVKELR